MELQAPDPGGRSKRQARLDAFFGRFGECGEGGVSIGPPVPGGFHPAGEKRPGQSGRVRLPFVLAEGLFPSFAVLRPRFGRMVHSAQSPGRRGGRLCSRLPSGGKMTSPNGKMWNFCPITFHCQAFAGHDKMARPSSRPAASGLLCFRGKAAGRAGMGPVYQKGGADNAV